MRNVVITRRRSVAEQDLTYLHREIREVARGLRRRRKVVQYHWGGGTPTYLKVDEMRALQQVVTECFEILPDAGSAIEVDPRVTSRGQIDLLRSMGFNRHAAIPSNRKTPIIRRFEVCAEIESKFKCMLGSVNSQHFSCGAC